MSHINLNLEWRFVVGVGRVFEVGRFLSLMVGKTRPLYLKRVSQSIATSLIRSYRQSGDRTDNQAIVPTIRRS
ncbi:hypothetical protein, partial [Microcoleus sp. CAWBG640]|uniref:hypothetical protein n=1 Tax=Microcoleus sp. CAWBG640 TaxID=2841653 RepID=UPI00312BB316